MSKSKKITIFLLAFSLILGLITNSYAVTEETKQLENNHYIITVTLKDSEKENYLNGLEQELEVDGTTFDYSNIETISSSETNVKVVTQEVEINGLYNTNNKDEIMQSLTQNYEYSDTDYSGTIPLTDVRLTTVDQGEYEQIESLDVPFSGLTQNELALIDKEIENGGYTWYLINVDYTVESTREIDGTSVPVSYSGTAHYQRVATYSYADRYEVTAIYEGEVTALDPAYTYEITYDEVIKLEITEPEIVEEPEPVEETNYTVPLIIGAIGILIILIVLLNRKNCFVYEKEENGKYKALGSLRITDKNIKEINIDRFNSSTGEYGIKFKSGLFNKISNNYILISKGSVKKQTKVESYFIDIKF